MLRSADLVDDPHVQERGVMEKVEHAVLGERLVVGPPWKMEGARIRSAAPLLGEHSEYVLKEVLGMGDKEIAGLTDEGVLN